MPVRLRKQGSDEHVYGATAPLRQRRFPRRTSYLRAPSVSSSTAPGRQQTLTQIDFARSVPHGQVERPECLENDEAEEEPRPKKRRRLSGRHVMGQQTLTQIDYGRISRYVDHETDESHGIGTVEEEQASQVRSTATTPPSTTRDKRKMGNATERRAVSTEQCRGAYPPLKQKRSLDKKGRDEGQQFGNKRKTAVHTYPSTAKVRNSATPVLDSSRKREDEDGRRLMEPPVTPRKPATLEIPSSQSPSATPLTTRVLLFSNHAQRSPLREISLNLVPDATSPTRGPNTRKHPFRSPFKHAPSPRPGSQRSPYCGHAPNLSDPAESVSKTTEYPVDEENKENEDLSSHDKSYEAAADEHTYVSKDDISPSLYRCRSGPGDSDEADEFGSGDSFMVGPVTQDMRRYELLTRSQRQLMRDTQLNTQLRCMGPPEQTRSLRNPYSARPTSRPTLHRGPHASLSMSLESASCDCNTDAETFKHRTTPKSRQPGHEVDDVHSRKVAANDSSSPLVPSSQATAVDIDQPSSQIRTQRGCITHEALTDTTNQPLVKSCSPRSRQTYKARSPTVIPSSLPPSLSSSPLQIGSETPSERLPILPESLGDADLTVSQLLPESLMNIVLPPPPVLSQESVEDDAL